MTTHQPDAKLKEMILYISKKCMDDPHFGATKLNKILYFADFMSYRLRGKAITGCDYMRLDRGPVPKRMKAVHDEMRRNKDIHLELRDRFAFHHRTVALRDPDLDCCFAPSDIAFVDAVIEAFQNDNATDISEMSHGRAWRVARDRESIPYCTALISDEDLDDDDLEWAECVIDEVEGIAV